MAESVLAELNARACPRCGTPVQRTPDGTLADGMRAHCLVVHPREAVPRG